MQSSGGRQSGQGRAGRPGASSASPQPLEQEPGPDPHCCSPPSTETRAPPSEGSGASGAAESCTSGRGRPVLYRCLLPTACGIHLRRDGAMVSVLLHPHTLRSSRWAQPQPPAPSTPWGPRPALHPASSRSPPQPPGQQTPCHQVRRLGLRGQETCLSKSPVAGGPRAASRPTAQD